MDVILEDPANHLHRLCQDELSLTLHANFIQTLQNQMTIVGFLQNC